MYGLLDVPLLVPSVSHGIKLPAAESPSRVVVAYSKQEMFKKRRKG